MSITLLQFTEKIYACAATDTRQMLEYYQDYLKNLLNADQVIWHAAYKGKYGRELWHTKKMHNWKVVDIKAPIEGTIDLFKIIKTYFRQAKADGDVDPQLKLAVESAGRSRVHLLKDAINEQDWTSHWMKSMLDGFNVGERMVGVYTLSANAESYFLIDRRPNRPAFTEAERQVFFDALIAFPRLHYWLLLERGLVKPAKRPLSPRDKIVLNYLLGANSELEIADALSLTKGTVHNYVQNIYKNYGVNSRYALAQLWLGTVPSHK